jgi:hypothetical protein
MQETVSTQKIGAEQAAFLMKKRFCINPYLQWIKGNKKITKVLGVGFTTS